jgi:predicted O-methyltransferase YrrM
MKMRSLEIAKKSFSEGLNDQVISKFLRLKPNFSLDVRNSTERNIFLSDNEIEYLMMNASKASKNIVEIGTAYGGGAITLTLGSSLGNGTMVYSVDSFEGDSEGKWKVKPRNCKKNVSRTLKKFNLNHKVIWKLIEETSLNAAKKWSNGDIDLLFIDASHRYEDVKSDFEWWSKHLSKDGLVLFHDSRRLNESGYESHYLRGWEGPSNLVREIRKMNEYELVGEVNSISAFRKIKTNDK